MLPGEAVQEIIKAIEAVLAEGKLNQQQLTFVQTIYNNAKHLYPYYSALPELESALRLILPRVSNEFKTPLIPIQGYSRMLVEHPEQFDAAISPRQSESLLFISRQAEALSNWYQTIVDSAKTEMQQEYKALPEACQVDKILKHCEAVLCFYLREKPIQLSFSYPDNLPPIHVAAYHLARLIEHLVRVMAFELVEYGKIQISAEDEGNFANLRIFCTGLESSNAEIESLFVKEGRHLYRQRFEQHGGRIEFSQEAGLGAAVHLLISIAKN